MRKTKGKETWGGKEEDKQKNGTGEGKEMRGKVRKVKKGKRKNGELRRS